MGVTPGSHTMNSSSNWAPGTLTRRRAPTPDAAPSTSTFRTDGNHSGHRSWSASTSKTAPGDADVVARPTTDTGARSVQSMVRGSRSRLGGPERSRQPWRPATAPAQDRLESGAGAALQALVAVADR